MKLQSRNAIALGVVGLVLTATISIYGNYFSFSMARRELQEHAKQLKLAVAGSIGDDLLAEDYLSAQIGLNGLAKAFEDDAAYIVLTDEGGHAVLSAGPYGEIAAGVMERLHDESGVPVAGPRGQLVSLAGKRLFDFDDELFSGRYGLHLGFHPRFVNEFAAAFFRLAAIFDGVIILAVLSMLYFIRRSIIAPLARLNAAAARIRRGDYQARVAAKAKDEIGELAASFNTMAEALDRSDREMKKIHDHLEQLVDERTREAWESEKRYRRLSESAFEGIILHDQGVALDLNTTIARMFGYDPAEVLGKNIIELCVAPETRAVVLDHVRKGTETAYEAIGVRKDGTKFPIEIVARMVPYEGKTVRVAAVRDITERKRAEAALRESEERYRTLVESAAVCVKVFDTGLKLVAINPYGMAEHYLENRGADELRNFDFLSVIDEEFRGDVEKAMTDALRGTSSTLEIRHAPGTSKNTHCFAVISPIKNAEGKITNVLFLSTDITDRKQAEERAHELDVLKNKFITIVSHQLRTPLSAVRWNLDMLMSGEMGKLKPTQKEFLHLTSEANSEVIVRINDLLTAMDIEGGRFRVTEEDVSLGGMLESVTMSRLKKCETKNLTCRFAPLKKPLIVKGEPEKIRRIMEALVDNAILYTPEKGTIDVTLKKTGNAARFEITDTGIGIPTEEQSKVFTRFFRASNAFAVHQNASGLGLYIAKHFVEAHGGKIGFVSREGRGSAFWFEVPARPSRNS